MDFQASPDQGSPTLRLGRLFRPSSVHGTARRKNSELRGSRIIQGLGVFAAILAIFAAEALAATPDRAAGGIAAESRSAKESLELEKLLTGRSSFDRMIFDRSTLNSDRSSQSLVSAIRLIFPGYRLADQPFCSESTNSNLIFRVNRVKYIYADYPDVIARKEIRQNNLPKVIELAISPIGKANAFVFPAIRDEGGEEEAPRIVLTDGLLSEISSGNELAFVIGHELGHLNFEHIPISLNGFVVSPEQQQRIASIERQWEFQADSFAAQILEQRGLPRSTAGSALSILARVEHGADGGTHPNIEERLQNLGFSIPSGLNPHQNIAMSQNAAVNIPRLELGVAR